MCCAIDVLPRQQKKRRKILRMKKTRKNEGKNQILSALRQPSCDTCICVCVFFSRNHVHNWEIRTSFTWLKCIHTKQQNWKQWQRKTSQRVFSVIKTEPSAKFFFFKKIQQKQTDRIIWIDSYVFYGMYCRRKIKLSRKMTRNLY